jgi:hypothetical protein
MWLFFAKYSKHVLGGGGGPKLFMVPVLFLANHPSGFLVTLCFLNLFSCYLSGRRNAVMMNKLGPMIDYLNLFEFVFKSSVQRKLRWVESGINRWVVASDCGAGQYCPFLLRHHRIFRIFPFPVSTAHFRGEC